MCFCGVPFCMAGLIGKKQILSFHPIVSRSDLFRRCKFFVACDTTDDIPYILSFGTEDSLMIGTDYTHADQSAELRALDVIDGKAALGEITVDIAAKITDRNPRRFYGI